MHAIFGAVDVKPEPVRAFAEATVREARGAARDEPGVVQFRIVADADAPTRFHHFVIFRAEAAAEAHWGTENFTAWRVAVAAMLDGEPQRIGTMRTVFPGDRGLERQRAGPSDW